jgi:hypothetical protein
MDTPKVQKEILDAKNLQSQGNLSDVIGIFEPRELTIARVRLES